MSLCHRIVANTTIYSQELYTLCFLLKMRNSLTRYVCFLYAKQSYSSLETCLHVKVLQLVQLCLRLQRAPDLWDRSPPPQAKPTCLSDPVDLSGTDQPRTTRKRRAFFLPGAKKSYNPSSPTSAQTCQQPKRDCARTAQAETPTVVGCRPRTWRVGCLL